MKSRILLANIVFFVVVLLSSPAFAYAGQLPADKEYTITETQLTMLDNKLEQLSASNTRLAQESRMLKVQLEASKAALAEAKQRLAELQTQLAALSEKSKNNESLLESANQSLEMYAKQVKEQQQTIKRQRNIAYGLLAGVVVLAVK